VFSLVLSPRLGLEVSVLYTKRVRTSWFSLLLLRKEGLASRPSLFPSRTYLLSRSRVVV
jgi:hypothetical protein